MVRIAICDDDQGNLKYMRDRISESFQKDDANEEVDILLYETGKALVDAYVESQIDVAFLDIELGDECVGFDVARQLCLLKRNAAIVYMSNHDHYVAKGYVCRPLGFVRKRHATEDLEMVKAEIKLFMENAYKDVTFYDNSKPINVNLNTIYSIQSFDHEMNIKTNDSVLKIRDQLSRHITELQDNGFVILRRGTAVNIKYIQSIVDDKVTLFNGDKHTISRENCKEVKRKWVINKFE